MVMVMVMTILVMMVINVVVAEFSQCWLAEHKEHLVPCDDDDDDDGDEGGGGGRGFTRSTWCLAIRSVNTLLIAFTALEHKMNTLQYNVLNRNTR